jgi:hypothetical protein
MGSCVQDDSPGIAAGFNKEEQEGKRKKKRKRI